MIMIAPIEKLGHFLLKFNSYDERLRWNQKLSLTLHFDWIKSIKFTPPLNAPSLFQFLFNIGMLFSSFRRWGSFGTGMSYSMVVKEVIYYDNYWFNTDANYNFQTLNAFHSLGLTKGLVTGKLIRNIKTNTWQKMVMYYDYQGWLNQDFHLINLNSCLS